MLDYDYTRIGDADYLLPLNFELRSREGRCGHQERRGLQRISQVYGGFERQLRGCRCSRASPRRSSVRRSNKGHGLDAGNIKVLAAAHVLAHHLVVQQHHVAGGLLEFGAVALVGMARAAGLLCVRSSQRRSYVSEPRQNGQCSVAGFVVCGFFVKRSFVHNSFRSYLSGRQRGRFDQTGVQ